MDDRRRLGEGVALLPVGPHIGVILVHWSVTLLASVRGLPTTIATVAFLTVTAGSALAQQPRTVTGRTLSASDSSTLAGVRVHVVGASARGESDGAGRFVLRGVPAGAQRVVFERIGVAGDTVALAPGERSLVVYLGRVPVRLAPVIAEAASIARERFETRAQTSTVSLDPVEIRRAPALAEPDVTRAVELLPGAVAKSDFTRGFNVRGGETDENLLRLDGITIFNPFHLGGLFSTFNPDAVDRVDLLTGGFPAEYGGRLSSVLDVDLTAGNPTRVDVRGAVSVLSGRVLLSGPVGRSGATFLVGARRTYADQFADAFSDDPFTYYFGDLLAKVTVPVGARGTLAATAYWGRDALRLPWIDAEPGRDGIDLGWRWGNRLAGITWRQPVGSVEFEHHASVTTFSSTLGLVPDVTRADSDVRLRTVRTGLLVSRGTHRLRVGTGIEDYDVRYDFENRALGTQQLDVAYRPAVWSAYLDEQWRPARWLLVRPGVRVEHVTGGADFTGVSPRAGVKLFAGDDLAVTVSAGRYYQAIHSIRDQEQPVTVFDVWITADTVTPVARSDHLVFGLERWFGTDLSLSVEAYTKSFDDLVLPDFRDDPKVLGDEFVSAEGESHGLDVLVRRYRGRITGWISYGFAKTVRRTPDHPSFAPSHDRRHTLNIVLQAPGPLGSEMGIRWGYGSPLPYTGIVGQWLHREYDADRHTFDDINDESISTAVNGRRFPHYSRLDVGFRWRFEKWGGVWQPYFQVLNLYNRRNAWFYIFEYDRSPPTRRGFSQLPIVPSFGVEFAW